MNMKIKLVTICCFAFFQKSFAQSITLTPNQTLIKTTLATSEIDIINYGYAANLVGKSANGTPASPTNTQFGDLLFTLSAAGYRGGTNPFATGASIEFEASQNWENNNRGANIFFRTSSNGDANNPSVNENRMIITNNGFVGIGTRNPKAKLHISDDYFGTTAYSPSYIPSFIIEGQNSTTLNFLNPKNVRSGIIFGDDASGFENGSIIHGADSTLKITAGITTLFLDGKTGNMGIGNGVPKAKLSIEGDYAVFESTSLSGNSTFHNFNRLRRSVIAVSPSVNPSAVTTVTGINGGTNGLMLHIYARQGASLQILHNNSGSLAENRILTNNGSDITITNDGGLTMIYDGVELKWRVIGIAN
ncbi:MAG: hypothetical protein ACRCVT_09050 [Leadbetterella sp.]